MPYTGKRDDVGNHPGAVFRPVHPDPALLEEIWIMKMKPNITCPVCDKKFVGIADGRYIWKHRNETGEFCTGSYELGKEYFNPINKDVMNLMIDEYLQAMRWINYLRLD